MNTNALIRFDISKREQGLIALFAVLFALCFSIGDSFRDEGSILVYFSSTPTGILWLVRLVLYAIVGYIGINILAALVKRSRLRGNDEPLITKRWPVFLILLLGWIPYLLCFFPGSIPHDGMAQLNVGLGSVPPHNHHPAALSMLYGAVIKLARMVGLSDVMGVFIIVVLQTLFTAFVFAELIRFVDEVGRKRPLTIASIAFFALYPIWGMMVQALIKDTLYTAFFTLFVLGLAGAVLQDRPETQGDHFRAVDGHEPSEHPISVYASLVLGASGACFCRNNGVYVLLISLVVLLLLGKGVVRRKKIAVCLLSVAAVFFLVTGPVYSSVGVRPGSPKEMLSIPLQQMARYISRYDGEIAEGEREIIDRIIDYDAAKNGYDPTLSDNVKSTWKEDATGRDRLAFARLYQTFFMRHPGVFIEAPLHNSYNYYYFADMGNTMRDFQNYTEFKVNECLSYKDYIPELEGARGFAETWIRGVTALPLLNLLNRCGFYTWILLLCILSFLIRKRSRELVVVAPLVATVLICIASPVNGMHRYMWPVMATVVIPLAMLYAGELNKGVK